MDELLYTGWVEYRESNMISLVTPNERKQLLELIRRRGRITNEIVESSANQIMVVGRKLITPEGQDFLICYGPNEKPVSATIPMIVKWESYYPLVFAPMVFNEQSRSQAHQMLEIVRYSSVHHKNSYGVYSFLDLGINDAMLADFWQSVK